MVEGNSAINESALTGESIPLDKTMGDPVSAATTNQSGFIKCEATRVGEDTTLSQIIQMVSDAAATKAPIAKIADRVSGIFVPAVILLAVITFAGWMIAGQTIGFALAHDIAVLVISCPCALGLATPVAIMVGNGMGAKNGILFKTAVSLEEAGKIEIFVLDKTGTITAGEPKVTDIIPAEGLHEQELLTLAYALEQKGEHPLAMLTGDNERTARAIGKQAGVDEVIAGVLPDGKESVIHSLKEKGRIAMVGDGINDTPTLTRADIGIAIGVGADVAIDAADIVLMKSCLSDVPAEIRLSRATLRNIHENLFWAFSYNVIGIPLAAGVFIPLLGWQLNPMFGAAAMSISSFLVVTNALRLNLCKVHDARKDKKLKQKTVKKEQTTMQEKTLNIEGMSCGHCEARVKKALESVDGVSEVVVSHESKTAVVTLAKDVQRSLKTGC